MLRRLPLKTLLLLLLIGAWTANAQAGYIRYDVTLSYTPLSPINGSGYMVFNDTGPVPGDIFPNIVDWYFNVGGFVYNPSNTQPFAGGPFEVDENYNFVNDFFSGGVAGPCFSTSGCQDFSDTTLLAFTQMLHAARVIYPTGNGVSDTTEFGVSVQYSDPIFIAEVPLPSVLGLFAVALASLALSRRATAR